MPRPSPTKRLWEPSPEQLAIYADRVRCERTGETLASMAGRHGIAPQSIYNTIRRVEAWLRPRMMNEIRAVRLRHTDHLMHMFAEAMQAWERSKEDAVEQSDTTGGAGGDTTTVKRRKQAGNPAFLAEARAILADIRKMWGADEPQRFEHTVGGEIRVAGIPREQAIRERITVLQAALAGPKAEDREPTEGGAE